MQTEDAIWNARAWESKFGQPPPQPPLIAEHKIEEVQGWYYSRGRKGGCEPKIPTMSESSLPYIVQNEIQRIKQGTAEAKYYNNRNQCLSTKARYCEYRPDKDPNTKERLVMEQNEKRAKIYYTKDHYDSFFWISDDTGPKTRC